MASEVHAKNPLVLDDLYAAFEAADNIVLKKYIDRLSDAPCIEMSEDLKTIEIGKMSLYIELPKSFMTKMKIYRINLLRFTQRFFRYQTTAFLC